MMVIVNTTSALQRRRFDLVKEAVTIPILQPELGVEWHRTGGRWRGECPLCHNGGTSGAFSAGETLWHCFACMEGGDVITLAAKFNDMPPAMACAWLGDRFNVDLPERPESWYRKQDRQAKIRETKEKERREIKRRRLFKYLILPELEHVQPEAERKQETDLAWSRFQKLPLP